MQGFGVWGLGFRGSGCLIRVQGTREGGRLAFCFWTISCMTPVYFSARVPRVCLIFIIQKLSIDHMIATGILFQSWGYQVVQEFSIGFKAWGLGFRI